MRDQRHNYIDNVNVSEALRYLGYGDNKPDDNTKKIYWIYVVKNC